MSNRRSRIAALGCGLLAFCTAQAGELRVRVLDRTGKPVPEAVVAVQPQSQKTGQKTAAPPPPSAKPAVMDQINQQFVPHILVVQAGGTVTFPNSDTVSHQVYSFSPAKRFQLPLYRGRAHSPLEFPEPGIVVLGCNIHDGMIGYLYVAPGPHFGKTDAAGTLVLKDLPAGAYRLSAWHPRFDEPQAQLQTTVQVEQTMSPALDLRLTRELKPEPRTMRNTNDY